MLKVCSYRFTVFSLCFETDFCSTVFLDESEKKTFNRWTNDEVQALLSIYAASDIQQELETATHNEKVYAVTFIAFLYIISLICIMFLGL